MTLAGPDVFDGQVAMALSQVQLASSLQTEAVGSGGECEVGGLLTPVPSHFPTNAVLSFIAHLSNYEPQETITRSKIEVCCHCVTCLSCTIPQHHCCHQ